MIDASPTGLARAQAALAKTGLAATIVHPGQPMPTVPLAAAAVGCRPGQIIKTVIFTDPQKRTVVAIAAGTARIDRALLADAAGVAKVTLASPDFVLKRTGYPAGGVCPIGIRDENATVVMDTGVLAESSVYGGAGTEDDLLLIAVEDLLTILQPVVRSIVRSSG